VSGSQLPSLQNAAGRKVQQIQVRRKWRPEPHLTVSKILGLKSESAFIWLGGACARRQGPGPLPRGRGVGLCTSCGRRSLWRRYRRNLRPNMGIFSDFGGGNTHGGDGFLRACTDHRRRSMEGARALPTRTSIPTPKTGRLFTSTGGSLKELLCGMASSIITRPPPAPIQNVYLLQVLTLISIGLGGQSRGRLTVCCDCYKECAVLRNTLYNRVGAGAAGTASKFSPGAGAV
jgi:hypothetical protein